MMSVAKNNTSRSAVIALSIVMICLGTSTSKANYTPKQGQLCKKGSSMSFNGEKFKCIAKTNKRTKKTTYVWGKPTFEDSAVGVKAYIDRIPFQDEWKLGQVILDSEKLSFLPVDPEAVVLPDGRIRLLVDEPDGRAQIRTFTSSNGQDFVPEDVAPFQGTFPNVVSLPNGEFRLYFTRFDPVMKTSVILSAISSDALNWLEEPGIRAKGAESSALILKDGRILMAVRRDSTMPIRYPEQLVCNKVGSTIWFLTSSDGLTFTEVREVIDGVKVKELEGRAFGVELARLASGKAYIFYEGCRPMFMASLDEDTFALGKPVRTNLRSADTAKHIGFKAEKSTMETIGGDISHVVWRERDLIVLSTRTTNGTRFSNIRQQVLVAQR